MSEDLDLLNSESPETTTQELSEETPTEEMGEEASEPSIPAEEEDDAELPEATQQQQSEEEEEVEEELPSPYHRSSFKEIKDKYPNFFRDFPDMREVYFRERKFTEVFPTVEDAQEAFQSAEAFKTVEESLLRGSNIELLNLLEQANPESFKRVANNFLPEVYKKSPDLYYSIVTPMIGKFIHNLWSEGKKLNNQSMQIAAQYAMQFVYGHTNVEGIEDTPRQNPEVDAERQKLEQERQRIRDQKYTEIHASVNNQVSRILASEIDKGISDIKDSFKRKAAAKEIYEKLDNVLSQDSRHMNYMNSMWRRAEQNGFSPEWRSRLVTAFMARARQILPAIRKEIRAQAVKTEPPKVQTRVTGAKTVAPRSSSSVSPREIDWNKTSDMDILNDRITLKGKK